MTATDLTVGSLCSGIGGLELGLERAFDARTIWQAELDPHAATVLAAHWPGVPNLGDLTAVDWAAVEPVDVMCFGFPCQDISSAGGRAGLEGAKSALWFACADAVRLVRPRYVLVENVSALLVRGFDRVLADLAEMGYVGRWGCLRSSDIGAPHRRERVFVAATADTDSPAWSQRYAQPRDSAAPHVRGGTARRGGRRSAATDTTDVRHPGSWTARRRGLGPADCGDLASDTHGQRCEVESQRDGEAHSGLQPPRRGDPDRRRSTSSADPDGGGLRADLADDAERQPDAAWGMYAAAIRRWEAIHGPAPRPRDDRGRLNPALPEWMLGYPPGWVTVVDVPHTAQLRVLGNAVQPQVAEAAARLLLAPLMTEAAA